MTALTPPEVRAPHLTERSLRSSFAALAVLVLITEVVALSFLLVIPALAQMSASFQTAHISWMITTLSLVGAISVPLAGKSADIWGREG